LWSIKLYDNHKKYSKAKTTKISSLNIRLLQGQIALVVADVAEVNNQIDGNQQHVERIQVRNDIVVVKHLVGDAHGVADDKQNEKNGTFANHNFGTKTFHNGYGPAACKAEEHEDFEYTECG